MTDDESFTHNEGRGIMKVSITKPYWGEPIEDEVESITITKCKGYGVTVAIKGGKTLGNGNMTDDQLIITVTS